MNNIHMGTQAPKPSIIMHRGSYSLGPALVTSSNVSVGEICHGAIEMADNSINELKGFFQVNTLMAYV